MIIRKSDLALQKVNVFAKKKKLKYVNSKNGFKNGVGKMGRKNECKLI